MADQRNHIYFAVVLRKVPRSEEWLRAHLDLSLPGDFLDQDGDFSPYDGFTRRFQVNWKSRHRYTVAEYEKLKPTLKDAGRQLEHAHEMDLPKLVTQ